MATWRSDSYSGRYMELSITESVDVVNNKSTLTERLFWRIPKRSTMQLAAGATESMQMGRAICGHGLIVARLTLRRSVVMAGMAVRTKLCLSTRLM